MKKLFVFSLFLICLLAFAVVAIPDVSIEVPDNENLRGTQVSGEIETIADISIEGRPTQTIADDTVIVTIEGKSSFSGTPDTPTAVVPSGGPFAQTNTYIPPPPRAPRSSTPTGAVVTVTENDGGRSTLLLVGLTLLAVIAFFVVGRSSAHVHAKIVLTILIAVGAIISIPLLNNGGEPTSYVVYEPAEQSYVPPVSLAPQLVPLSAVHVTLPHGVHSIFTASGGGPPPGPSPECSDGQDNDNDGATDWLDDNGCDSQTDDDERCGIDLLAPYTVNKLVNEDNCNFDENGGSCQCNGGCIPSIPNLIVNLFHKVFNEPFECDRLV